MALYHLMGGKLIFIKEVKIDLEKELQRVTEDNLEAIFGLKLVDSEFVVQGLRVDTLAYEIETKSFVIIEYKREGSSSIVDQGYAYLGLMLNNKADFILQHNEKMRGSLKRSDIAWEQSKVLFLANSFNVYQQSAINFKDLPFELWEVRKYEGGLFSYAQLKPRNASESIKTVRLKGLAKSVSKQVKTYSVDDHFRKGWTSSREIFESMRSRILALDPQLEEKPRKFFIGYGIGRQNVVQLRVFKGKVALDLLRTRPDDVNDPEKRVEYMENSMKWFNQNVSTFEMKKIADVEYGLSLAKQVLDAFLRNQ